MWRSQITSRMYPRTHSPQEHRGGPRQVRHRCDVLHQPDPGLRGKFLCAYHVTCCSRRRLALTLMHTKIWPETGDAHPPARVRGAVARQALPAVLPVRLLRNRVDVHNCISFHTYHIDRLTHHNHNRNAASAFHQAAPVQVATKPDPDAPRALHFRSVVLRRIMACVGGR